jgi:two-component system response regulator FixJ
MPAEQKHLYIVDDDESVCRSLKILLSTYGFEVSTFLSAEKFFSDVPNNEQGCLILDIHMPGLNGWEALKRIIELRIDRPVIMISANKTDGNTDRALKSGAVGFLLKPFTDQALVTLINAALEEPKPVLSQLGDKGKGK